MPVQVVHKHLILAVATGLSRLVLHHFKLKFGAVAAAVVLVRMITAVIVPVVVVAAADILLNQQFL